MCSQTEQLTVLWILFASIVIGNIAVLLALLPSKSRKSRMNFFIKHLALAGKKLPGILLLKNICHIIT
jgi:neuropeptide S receptor 1